MQKTDKKVADFLEASPAEFRDDLKKLEKLLSKVLKSEPKIVWEGVFWGGSDQTILGYGELSYQRSDKQTVEWFKVGLAAQKNYISLYVSAVDGKKYLTEEYGKKLGKTKVGKSSVSFKSLDEIDLEILEEFLVRAKELMS